MDATRERIKDLLLELAQLSGDERMRRIADIAAADPSLGAELRSLAQFLDSGPAQELPLPPISALASGALQRRLGPWQLQSEIGRGGVGVVYLARRADGAFEGQAAVKMLSPLLATPAQRWRFVRECQTLADLSHPHVARLLDAGTTADGATYIVMEHVDGEPIDTYCRIRALPLGARLHLVLQLCAALGYIHSRLVVHRDLKPGNVLVDRSGNVKLLDFGLAKLIEEPGVAATLEERMFTPAFASPEQVSGATATTASDVFSLGCLLYELVTDRHPFAEPGATPLAVLQAIARQDPPPPSRVAPRVSADLDAIILCALQKKPEDRYRSVDALADDLQRLLDGFPVRAYRQSPLYRASKFVRRHWVGSTAAALALAAIVGFAVRAELLAVEAERQRAVAEQRFQQVRRLARAVIFEYDRALSQVPGTLEVRRKLVADSLTYLDALAAESGMVPELMGEVADAYSQIGDIQGRGWFGPNLGDFPAAQASFAKALALRRALLAQAPQDEQRRLALVAVLEKLGDVQVAQARLEQGLERYAEGEKLLADLSGVASQLQAALLAQKQGNFAIRRAEGLRDAAAHYDRQHRYLEVAARTEPDNIHLGVQRGFNAYSRSAVRLQLGKPAEAEALARESLVRHQQFEAAAAHREPADVQLGARVGTALARMRIGETLLMANRVPEALQEIEAATRVLESSLAQDPKNLAVRLRALHVLRRVVLARLAHGEAAAAAAAARRAMDIAAALPASDQRGVTAQARATAQRSHGVALAAAGQAAQAVPVMQESCTAFRAFAQHGEYGPVARVELAGCLADQARVLALARDGAQAQAVMAEAIALRRAWLEESPSDALNAAELALAYHHAAAIGGVAGAARERDALADGLAARSVLVPLLAHWMKEPANAGNLLVNPTGGTRARPA